MLQTGKITTDFFYIPMREKENFLRIQEELDDLLILPFKFGGINY